LVFEKLVTGLGLGQSHWGANNQTGLSNTSFEGFDLLLKRFVGLLLGKVSIFLLDST